MILALTRGEETSIAPHLTLQAWKILKTSPFPFFVIENPDFLYPLAAQHHVPFTTISQPEQAQEIFPSSLPIWPLKETGPAATIESIKIAFSFCQKKRVAAMVTNPISKTLLHQHGFQWPGHTEFLAHLSRSQDPIMMLLNQYLRVVPLTRHIPLSAVPSTLSQHLIIKTATTLHTILSKQFRLQNPAIAVAGLNPHASENGLFGQEEPLIIKPAINALRKKGLNIHGPFPPDTLFIKKRRHLFHLFLCLYHDQAFIPIKTLDLQQAVNITLNLPLIRTSPAHGTGEDIIPKQNASPLSLVAAIKQAAALYQTSSAP